LYEEVYTFIQRAMLTGQTEVGGEVDDTERIHTWCKDRAQGDSAKVAAMMSVEMIVYLETVAVAATTTRA
jgi:hypothetical protein